MPVRFQLVIDCKDPDLLARFWAVAQGLGRAGRSGGGCQAAQGGQGLPDLGAGAVPAAVGGR
jgi:hypothetical protein